jgi:hypothetical protein
MRAGPVERLPGSTSRSSGALLQCARGGSAAVAGSMRLRHSRMNG